MASLENRGGAEETLVVTVVLAAVRDAVTFASWPKTPLKAPAAAKNSRSFIVPRASYTHVSIGIKLKFTEQSKALYCKTMINGRIYELKRGQE